MKCTRVVSFCIVVVGKLALALTNPVPLINQPLVPMTAAPGGSAFTVTVNGTGFVSASTVNWNGLPLQTTFVTASQLTALVPASEIAKSGTASVTIVNPTPGGGTSNVVFFDISSPVSTLTFASFYNVGGGSFGMVTADFNGDGKLDLAELSNSAVFIQLGNGDGSFQAPVKYAVGQVTTEPSLVVGDFDGDGKLDIAVANAGDNTVSVLIGNGDGTFQPQTTYATANGPTFIVAGDFNGDGKLDLVTGNNNSNGNDNSTISVLLGNGDGTFQSHVEFPVGGFMDVMTMGDFNGDGKLDLACARSSSQPGGTGISILLGNGDGTFAAPTFMATSQASSLITADLNGDGKLDLILVIHASPGSVDVLLGNGDGSFQSGQSFATGNGALAVALGDLNADGKLDLAVADANSNLVSLLVGNGDGTFQPAVDLTANLQNFSNTPLSLSIADFNGDGSMDVAVLNANESSLPPLTLTVLLQGSLPAALVLPPSLTFGQQAIGTSSAPQTATLTNTGTAPLALSSLGITGPNTADFALTNGCGPTLIPKANCQISVTFTPKAGGNRSAAVTIASNGPGSPQAVTLTGTTPPAPAALLSPVSVAFPNQFVGTSGLPQNVTLTNTGTASLTITNVDASPGDFGVLSACGNSVAPGSSCTIGVFFDPKATGARTGQLTVTDNAADSPQTVQLNGTGQDFSMTQSSSSTATVTPGQTATYTVTLSSGGGFNQTVTLSCSGAPAQSTCSVSPASVAVSGSNATSVTVTVTTTGTSGNLVPPSFPPASTRLAMWLALVGLPGLTLLAKRRDQRNKRLDRLLYTTALLCLSSLAITLSGCGGGGSTSGSGAGGTQAGTFTLNVTGTFQSGSTTLTHTTQLTLVVQ